MQWNARIFPIAFFCSLISFSQILFAHSPADPNEASKRRLLGLIEYLSGDYPAAVSDGKIINEGEYQEMKEFSQTAIEIAKNLTPHLSEKANTQIDKALKGIQSCVLEKCTHEKILSITRPLRNTMIEEFQLSRTPSVPPSFELGKMVYMQHCASCHGVQGKGDGPLASTMEPKPSNFQDPSHAQHASPFKVVNTLKTGITGTGMRSFEGVLQEEEMWSVAFYALGMRFHKDSSENVKDIANKEWSKRELSQLPLDLAFLAGSNDADLEEWVAKNSKDTASEMAFLRAQAPYADILAQDAQADLKILDFVDSKIKESQEKFAQKEFREASELLLDAYLDGFEKVEASLAVVDHNLLLSVERNFSVARSYASKGDAEHYEEIIPQLLELTKQVQIKLKKPHTTDGAWDTTDFISSLVIIVREGFEAFLIIIALLMIVGAFNAPHAKIWIHAGWMSACLFGFIAYFIFEYILKISGSTRESIEAFCTLAATIVLFYTGFWLLSHAEHTRWQKYIKERTNVAVSTQRLWILFGISFIAVFRESAETVLFYSALLSNAKNPYTVFAGFISGLGILFLVCLSILKYHVRLPLKHFFMGTSTFMVGLSIILAGKTVHELIAAGYLKATPLKFLPVVDVLGLYPLMETFLAQCFVIVLTLALVLKRKAAQA